MEQANGPRRPAPQLEQDNSPVIATIRKNIREVIKIETSHYNGYDLVNIRVWAKSEGIVDYIPTKAGIACRVELLPEIIEALQAAEEQSRRVGLL